MVAQPHLLALALCSGSLPLWPWAEVPQLVVIPHRMPGSSLPIGFESVEVSAAEPAWRISGPLPPRLARLGSLLLLFNVQRGVPRLSGQGSWLTQERLWASGFAFGLVVLLKLQVMGGAPWP